VIQQATLQQSKRHQRTKNEDLMLVVLDSGSLVAVAETVYNNQRLFDAATICTEILHNKEKNRRASDKLTKWTKKKTDVVVVAGR
jgi:hypothetical protein